MITREKFSLLECFEMNRTEESYQLMCCHQYSKAEKILARDYSSAERGGAQLGDIIDYAIVLVGNQKYDRAIDHITKVLISKRGTKPSKHEIILGIAHWYSSEFKKAVDCWKLALKANAASDKGYTDVYSMLFFAAIQRPKLVDYEELVKQLTKYQGHLDANDYPDKVYKYYQGKLDGPGLMGYSTLCNIGFNEDDIQYDTGELKDRGKAYFHIALNCLRNQDPKGYYDNLRHCVNTKYDQYQVEFLVAYLEVQRLKREKTL
jgi:tetratricopeptide (TPR) repeat protein